ncbi:Serine/threonine-protein phosphatase 7 long form-like [Vitis vinifera]|uniref:Serine/threonine-protein phosphatase 7 long form-like n=1 Tax=Vitis vinifera TaxID=29760 RepID=A0A438FP15_VITVI|nr:Serine/threonine-protein phosphatase 7 long form-like [Vitis vinifera]
MNCGSPNCLKSNGCRWRVPLSWAQNPSRVLTFYRDQLDAQTHDQTRRFGRCHLLFALTLSSGIDRSECCEVWPSTRDTSILFHRLDLHSVDRRGRHKYDWGAFHASILPYGLVVERIVTAPPMVGAMQFHDPYMEWYRRITRRLITPLSIEIR